MGWIRLNIKLNKGETGMLASACVSKGYERE